MRGRAWPPLRLFGADARAVLGLSTWVVPVVLLRSRAGCCRWRAASRAGMARRDARRPDEALAPRCDRATAGCRKRRPDHAATRTSRAGARAKALQQVLRRDRDHPRRRPRPDARRTPRADRAERRRQVDAVPPDLRPASRRPPARSCFDGRPIAGWPPQHINRLGLARSFQITNIFPRLTVFENLRIGVMAPARHRFTLFWRVGRQCGASRGGRALLERVRLRRRRDTLAGEMAYSEQRSLEIGDDARLRPEGDPARRTDGRHVARGDRTTPWS